MKTFIYWALGGIGGVQRFDAFMTKALHELGLDVTILIPSNINFHEIEKYHGINLRELIGINIIRYKTVNCTNQYCNLLNSWIGDSMLNILLDNYDLLFLDSLPKVVPNNIPIVFYLHAAITTPRPRPVLTAKPHRLFLHALLSMGSRYDFFKNRIKHVYANSLFTAQQTEKALGIRPGVLYPPIDTRLIGKYATAKKEPIVSMLARFSSSKGQEFVIRRSARLCRYVTPSWSWY